MEAVTEALERFAVGLTRDPDFDAQELRAFDTADLLILATAADRLTRAEAGTVVTIGDTHGALTLGAVSAYGAADVRSAQDPLLGERALAANAARLGLEGSYRSEPLGEALLSGAKTVLVQLPRGHEALADIAWHIARYAHPDVRVFAGARVKHMSLAQNAVLGEAFGEVRAGRGWRKARVLEAASPKPAAAAPFPKWGRDADLRFSLAAFGHTFGGTKFDHGSRLLLATLDGRRSGEAAGRRFGDFGAAPNVFDLGCGSGVLAVSAALALPAARVIASDQSDAAVRAATLTAAAAGVGERIAIHRADGAEAVADGWADLVLLNPPFHTGATVHVGVGQRLIRECGRVLRPGGELRLVFNSHLNYRPLLEQVIGPVTQLARDRTFTVLAATKR